MLVFLVACADPPTPPASADPVETCAPGGEGSDPYVPAGAAALAEVVQREVDAWPAAGVGIATARGDEVTFAAGFGSADPLTGLAATADTPFLLGSVSKTVIGVLAMQLVEEGRLDLDADVGPLVGYEVRNPYHPDVPVTVRMLLTHTSTLWDTPATWDSTGWTAGDADQPMEDFVAAYFTPGDPLYGGRDAWWDPAPGELYCYSNMAVALAAVAIEHVAGDDLEALAQARIFGPLGMDRTSYRIDAYCDPADLARGVAWDGDQSTDHGRPTALRATRRRFDRPNVRGRCVARRRVVRS